MPGVDDVPGEIPPLVSTQVWVEIWRGTEPFRSTPGRIEIRIFINLSVRNAFGLVFGLPFAAAMVAAGRWLSGALNDVLLKALGLCSCLYAVIDIKEDLVSRTVAGSDAFEMAELMHLPPVVLGVLWMGMALSVGAVALRLALAVPEQAPLQGAARSTGHF